MEFLEINYVEDSSGIMVLFRFNKTDVIVGSIRHDRYKDIDLIKTAIEKINSIIKESEDIKTNTEQNELIADRWLMDRSGKYTPVIHLDRARAAVAEERRKREAADERAERAERQLLQELKTRTERPDFKTYADLKHGTAGAILWALQNGEISRGKAAEALAEWAHGVDPQLPKLPDAIPDDVTPLDLMRERDEARARAEAAEAETQRLREALLTLRLASDELAKYGRTPVFETLLRSVERQAAQPAAPAATEPPANQCTCSTCGCRLAIGRNDGFLCGGCAEDCQQTVEWWQKGRPSAKPKPAAMDPWLERQRKLAAADELEAHARKLEEDASNGYPECGVELGFTFAAKAARWEAARLRREAEVNKAPLDK